MQQATPFPKHIAWVGNDDHFGRLVGEWTLKWFKNNGFPAYQIVRTQGLEMALQSLEKPLRMGNPPDLVIIDRSPEAVGIDHFSTIVADCIPETWVIELVLPEDTIQADGSVMYMKKPFHKQDWLNILRHCFVDCPNPQWSRSTSARRG